MSDKWRPFEPSKDALEAAAKARTEQEEHVASRLASTRKRTCKLHRDCREADELVRAAGGREITCEHTLPLETCLGCRVFGRLVVMTAKHE